MAADYGPARRAGAALAARRRGVRLSEQEDEWLELRREIIARGGIGPSPDWESVDWPGDLYREHGRPPDLVATETALGRSDRPPWQGPSEVGPSDTDMHRYLQRAYRRHQQITGAEKRAPAELPEEAEEYEEARRAGGELARKKSHHGRRELEERERRAHEERMSAFVQQAIAARRAAPRAPAIGFYTDRKDVVHPITSRRAGLVYARRRNAGRPRGVS